MILASGPSLTASDVAATAAFPTLAISNTFQQAPHAAVVYAPDRRWWTVWHPEAVQHRGMKFGVHAGLRDHPIVEMLRREPGDGLSADPDRLRGTHAGTQAINFAVLAGAKRLILLGYDMGPAPDGRNHYFGEHPDGSHVNYVRRLQEYETLGTALRDADVQVWNCSRTTRITAFARPALETVLRSESPTVH